MEIRTVHAIISGRVQGVCFRAYTREKALQLGINGFVRNLHDGNVEAIIQGNTAQIKQMRDWFHKGSPFSQVNRISCTAISKEKAGLYSSFSIRYS